MSSLKAEAGQTQTANEHPLKTLGKEPTRLRWVEGGTSIYHEGTPFGVPWPMGKYAEGTEFTLLTPEGKAVPMQTWTTATWPDGSLKWTGHTLAPDEPGSAYYEIIPGPPEAHPSPVRIETESKGVVVDTGRIRCTLPRKGASLISAVKRDGTIILMDGQLVGSRQDSPEPGNKREEFTSEIQSVSIEQDGPIRAVVRIEGLHRTDAGRDWLPFILRLYFHAGSDSIRITHTFVFDGDEQEDYISGLGLRFSVPMKDELYNRHIRFAAQENGLWGESVQGLTGLRRDPGKEVRAAQIAGEKVPDIRTWSEDVSTRLHWIPTWGDFSLSQMDANGFSIRKRTKPGCGWINAAQGHRSEGLGYVGGASGGVVFGMRDFWKLHPTQMDIRNAATDLAQVTIWMWSPDSPAMDLRFYHDGLGQEVTGPIPGVKIDGIEPSMPNHPYEKQVDALQVTYEDYEPGFGTPNGVARSTDITLKVVASTPSREELVKIADSIFTPPQLVPRPEDMLRAKVFSTMWNLPNRSSGKLAAMEDRLDWSIQFYKKQVDQHHWYGFWDYGDVMHTYDADRHVWRYDVGGYAWDNSELSTDMWLWYTFLRSGNPDAFRLAEAMNRHNRDVDIYHLGRFAGFGTRHNVQHWGCSAKQLRISTCMNRRFHYYLTTDERTGDVLREVVEADRQLATLNARRKVSFDATKPEFFEPRDATRCRISVGTDYGAAVSNWLTAYERTGDPKYRAWIENSMRSIGSSRWGFFTNRFWFDPETKEMTPPENEPPMASHLSIMFGLPEVVAELIQVFDIPEFKAAWLQYCELWNAPREVLDKELGEKFKAPGFPSAHSRITAYAAATNQDDRLAARAASEFLNNNWKGWKPKLKTEPIEGPNVLNPVDEATWVSTNQSAQWGLAAIQTSALVADAISEV
ncbi:MAG: Tat pathway signal sequence domain protein [Puniceicoccaceae bacterium]